jgi:hypothetical protein
MADDPFLARHREWEALCLNAGSCAVARSQVLHEADALLAIEPTTGKGVITFCEMLDHPWLRYDYERMRTGRETMLRALVVMLDELPDAPSDAVH